MKNTETTGGTRYSEGKPGAWWNIPMYGLRLVAPVSEMGGEKYAPLDWQEGQSFSTLWNSFMRHLLEAQHHGLWARDPDSGLFHLAHMAWNLLCLLTWMALDRHDLDDVTPWRGVTASKAAQARELADGAGITPEKALEIMDTRYVPLGVYVPEPERLRERIDRVLDREIL